MAPSCPEELDLLADVVLGILEWDLAEGAVDQLAGHLLAVWQVDGEGQRLGEALVVLVEHLAPEDHVVRILAVRRAVLVKDELDGCRCVDFDLTCRSGRTADLGGELEKPPLTLRKCFGAGELTVAVKFSGADAGAPAHGDVADDRVPSGLSALDRERNGIGRRVVRTAERVTPPGTGLKQRLGDLDGLRIEVFDLDPDNGTDQVPGGLRVIEVPAAVRLAACDLVIADEDPDVRPLESVAVFVLGLHPDRDLVRLGTRCGAVAVHREALQLRLGRLDLLDDAELVLFAGLVGDEVLAFSMKVCADIRDRCQRLGAFSLDRVPTIFIGMELEQRRPVVRVIAIRIAVQVSDQLPAVFRQVVDVHRRSRERFCSHRAGQAEDQDHEHHRAERICAAVSDSHLPPPLRGVVLLVGEITPNNDRMTTTCQ